MAARKTTKKASGTKKAAAKKPATRKPAAKKAPAKKKAAAAKSTPAKKKAAAKSPPAKAEAAGKPAEKKAPAAKAGKGVSSTAVNLGAIFALRPRVNTSFRQEHFLQARRLLDDEAYATLEEASRAVVEKALSLSNDPKGKRGQKRGR
jgi:hypothetical protein